MIDILEVMKRCDPECDTLIGSFVAEDEGKVGE